jgi:hypothetical protein
LRAVVVEGKISSASRLPQRSRSHIPYRPLCERPLCATGCGSPGERLAREHAPRKGQFVNFLLPAASYSAVGHHVCRRSRWVLASVPNGAPSTRTGRAPKCANQTRDLLRGSHKPWPIEGHSPEQSSRKFLSGRAPFISVVQSANGIAVPPEIFEHRRIAHVSLDTIGRDRKTPPCCAILL